MSVLSHTHTHHSSHTCSDLARRNRFAWLVGDVKNSAAADVPIRINQDANIHVAEIDSTASIDDAALLKFEVAEGRQAYVLNIEGATQIADGVVLEKHEAATVIGPAVLSVKTTDVKANGNSHVLIVEMKQS